MGELDRRSGIGFMRLATVQRNAENQQRSLQENWGQQSQLHVSEQCQNRVDYGLLDRFALADFQLYPCEAANSTSNLGIFLRDSGNAGSFLIDRSRDPHPSHLGQQRGSFQSQFRGSAARSTNDPASLLKCVHNQSAIRVFQCHR